LLGGLACATGILTYSYKVMNTIGNNILELSSEAALVVVLAQALVLFIFSSTGLSNLFVKAGLPPIPMVPVSSSQVIVGCILGIGLYKGARNINFKVLGEIGLAWIISPVASGLLTFLLLFFMKNVFGLNVGRAANESAAVTDQTSSLTAIGQADASNIIKYLLFGLFIFGTIGIIFYILLENKKKREMQRSEEKFWKNMK
jgi:phosphate/sulfate permease